MDNLTDTELIATRLLGWEPYKPNANYDHCRCYRKGRQWEGIRIADGSRYCENDNWPDLTNWNDIRRMEDALAEKGLLMLITEPHFSGYVRKLLEEYRSTNPDANYYEAALRATPAQRVAACVKVLRELERAEIDGRAK